MKMSDLPGRLRALEDERSILRLLHDYGRTIDYGDARAWLGLFAADARFELRYRPGLAPTRSGAPVQSDASLVYEGRDMLESFIAAHTHAPGHYHKHIVTGARIDIDGDTARSESYFLRIDELDGSPIVVASGRYLDVFSRKDEHCWMFRHRLAEIEARRPAA